MTPTRAQIDRSKKRNRERHGEDGIKRILEAANRQEHDAETRDRLLREAKAGPRWRSPGWTGPGNVSAGTEPKVVDAWGGKEPPDVVA